MKTKTSAKKPSKAKLSHIDARGRARMVDVGEKPETERVAVAESAVRLSMGTLAMIEVGGNPKGDVLGTARLAGMMASKRTHELIPLCHPIRIVGAKIELTIDRELPGVRIEATVRAFDRTGVEMEALTAASVAALTIYDMTKAVERGAEIVNTRLVEKAGGRSGHWKR